MRIAASASVTLCAFSSLMRATFLCPMTAPERMGIAGLVREQYGM